MTKRQKRLEQMHIVSTLINYGPMAGREVAERCNEECCHDAFEALPEMTPRGIGAKLSGLWTHGFVKGAERATFSTPTVYEVTEKGQRAYAIFEREESIKAIEAELEVARRA